MKSYSSDSVSQEQVQAAALHAISISEANIREVDIRQAKQITFLRWAVGVCFLVNTPLLLIIALRVFG